MYFNFNTTLYLRLLLCFTIVCFYSVNSTAQLTADFAPDKTGGCAPLAVAFTNQTTGASANAVYHWDFENGNTSAILNPGAIFKNEQIYNVTLTVKDGNLSSSKTKPITIYAPPTADFSVSPVKGCSPFTVNVTANASGGNGGINNYTWDFGDGNIQQGFNASQSHTYTVSQKATVSLTVSNNFGCTKTIVKPNLVNILPSVQAAFSASQTVLCRVTDAVQFINTSSGPGTLSYLWDFGDGTTSTLATPSHVFNIKGIYTVTLTVNSSEGCTATTIQNGYINVASFTTDFTVPALICNSSNYVTINTTSNPVPTFSLWTVDGVDQYNNTGNLYTTFPNSGAHTIKLTNTFGTCIDSASKTFIVKQTPDPQGFISVVANDCGAPVICNFRDTTPGGVKWEWNFNSLYYDSVFSRLQAPSYTYTNDGQYAVRLKVETADGCSAVVYKYVNITRPYVYIVADGNSRNCGPVQLKFKGYISTLPDTISTYNWNFGDGTSSSVPEPDHLFGNPGNYSVTLNYTTSSGCTGTVSHGNIIVYAKPVASFAVSDTVICGNTPVTFAAVNQGTGITYLWDFGDGLYAFNNSTTTHQYYYDSVYTVTLVVTAQGYCSDTMTKTNYIRVRPPFPRITAATNTCDGNRGTVTFYQDSKKAVNWVWDFGDGSSRTLNVDSPAITHNYSATGTYKVVLTTTHEQCVVRDSITVHVLLKQHPLLTASASSVCTNGQIQVTINNLQNNPAVSIVNSFYYLNRAEYNDLSWFAGNIDNNQNYYWGNTYNGTMSFFEKGKTGLRIILNSIGFYCQDTTNFIPLSVKGSNAGFEVLTDDVCFKSPVVLRDTSKTNSKIISWQWNFGDGTAQNLDHGGIVSHVYNPGAYDVTLTITDTSGCSTSSNFQNRNVSVNGPKAIFNASSNNTFITLPVYFYNYTNNYNSYNTEYKWAFGDGSTSIDFSPTHTYPLPGQYTVTLIAKNPATGCTDTTSQQVIVNNFAPAFSVSSLFLTANNCPPVLVRLSNNSISYSSVKWDFGDGITAGNLNYPAHIYEKPGKYIITLYVYGQGGLTGTYLDSITIKQPSAVVRVDKKDGCIGLVATLSGSIKNSTAYTWDFGDGSLVSGNDTIVSHQYNVPGIYKPYLLLADTNGCNTFSSLNDSIKIRSNPVVVITPTNPLICRGQSIVLTASGGAFYTWSPANGLSNGQAASTNANPVTTTSYTVTVKDDIGCTNTGNVQVVVVQKSTIKLRRDTAICLGNTIQLNASGTNTYKWIFNTAGLSNTNTPNPVANPLVNTTYTVSGSDQYNCFSDTAKITVKVLPLPTVNISAIPDVLLGTPVRLTSTSSADVIQWAWSPADYLSCTNCPSPVSTPLGAVTYKLLVTNRDGCTATANVSLKLQCQESLVFIPSAFSPNDDGRNDVFSVKGISIVKHMVIYNRWGKQVYERSNFLAGDRSTGWDGRHKGEPLAAGAYTYFVEMECPTGGVFFRKGTVMLVR